MTVGESKSDVAERVLNAAKEVFFARGFHYSSLLAIAKKAGTSESGVLRFYRGKLHLLQCVYASCWTEINARVDKALAAAAKQDPDPRNLLLQLMRGLLDDYHAAEPMPYFLLTTFGFEQTTGCPIDDSEVDNDADSEARRQYHRYLTVVNDLCDNGCGGSTRLRTGGHQRGRAGTHVSSHGERNPSGLVQGQTGARAGSAPTHD